MAEYKLGELESVFAEIIWNNQPLTSRRLAQLAEERLTWKRTTTYTILKRMCGRNSMLTRASNLWTVISTARSRPSWQPLAAGSACPIRRSMNCKKLLIP